ncbi:MAG: hypothetical protein ACYDCL_10755 [Myxococcales bacterium]
MNPLLRLVLLLAAVIAAGGFGLHEYLHQKTEMESRLDVARIERTFDERVAAAREIAPPEEYGDEMRGLLKWYFGALRDHDNRYPEFRDHDKGWEDIQHKHDIGRIKGPEYDAFKANRAAVMELYKQLSGTGYDPVLAASSAGQHFDIWRMERQTQDGKPKVRIDFAWWGPQRKDEVEERSDTAAQVHHLIVNAAVNAFDITLAGDKPAEPKGKKGKKAGKDEAAAFHGELHGGEPETKIPDPDRYADLFPANVVLGTYWLDLFPHEANKMHVEISGTTRTVQGHELNGKFAWDVPLKEDWKLGEGESWEGATVETRDEDEGGAQADAAEKPAAKGHHRH